MVDDDPSCRQYLNELLSESGLHVAGQAANIQEAEGLIHSIVPDLVFLDVEMPGGSGFDLLSKLGNWSFDLVFTTGFSRYAIQAIRFSALDYLLKPVQPDELDNALKRFKDRHPEQIDRSAVQEQFIRNISDEERAMKLTLTRGDRSFFVSPEDLTHCLADGNYTELHLLDGRRFISARTLKEYEDMLQPWGFLRVHRSALVNRGEVAHVEAAHAVLSNGVHVEISRRKRQEVLKALKG